MIFAKKILLPEETWQPVTFIYTSSYTLYTVKIKHSNKQYKENRSYTNTHKI